MRQQSRASVAAAVGFGAAASCVLSVVMVFGCGDGSSTPHTPTPVVTTRSIVVTLPTGMAVGDSVQATASATLSDGSARAITNGFRSDVTSVATVTDAGMVTAVASGRANIYVVSDGQQGTRNIQVNPNYSGNWSGSYYVTSCSHSGDFAAVNFCGSFTPNRVLPYNMSLSQTVDTVTGATYLGSLRFSQASATIGASGEVSLPGTYVEDTLTIACTWDITSPAPGRLNGTVRQVWRDSDAAGEMVVTGTIRDSMKMASAVPTTDSVFAELAQRWLRRIRR
jgi:hypothetical protein